MTDRENLPAAINQQAAVHTGQRGSLVMRGLAAIQERKGLALTKANNDLYREARDVFNLIVDDGMYHFGEFPWTGHWVEKSFEAFQLLADRHYGKAYFPLHEFYSGGKGIEGNPLLAQRYGKLAFDWCLANQHQNDAEIWKDLGWLYYRSDDIENKNILAHDCFLKAADLGSANAMFDLCAVYEDGYGVEQDFDNALYWQIKAAEAGNVQAQHGLEIQHDREHLDIENEQVFGWYIHTAEKGYVWAQLFLAEEFRHGLVIGENSNYSAYWFRMAAKQGEAKAQWQLGLMYWTGQGVEQSDEQAEYWLLKAAEQDFPEAQYDLAQFFGEIVGLDEDFLRWMNRAAELGYGPAQYYLAEFDDYLPDDERDDLLEKSLAWYEERAEQGDAKMQYEYARLHLDEKNWRADRGIGLHFLNMAAEQHHPLACRR